MYCPKCGLQNSEEVTVCASCGTVLEEPSATPTPAAPAEPKTSGLAITSLVLGGLSIFCNIFTAIPAIICAIIALLKISKSQGKLKGNGFAIAGIAVPVVAMVLILPLMLAIFLPAFSKAKTMAMRVACMSNLKGLSVAMTVYSNDYDDEYPTPEQWCDLLIQEAGVSMQSLQCPESLETTFAYALNENLKGLKYSSVKEPTQVVVLFEADLGKNGVGGRDDVVLRHDDHGQTGCNIAFADGHIEFVTEDRLDDLVWTVE